MAEGDYSSSVHPSRKINPLDDKVQFEEPATTLHLYPAQKHKRLGQSHRKVLEDTRPHGHTHTHTPLEITEGQERRPCLNSTLTAESTEAKVNYLQWQRELELRQKTSLLYLKTSRSGARF